MASVNPLPLPFDAVEVEGAIGARFEKVAALCPDQVAVETAAGRVTYAELNRQANQIAASLLDLAGPGLEPVALLMDHDAPLIAAVFGVLKAGKVFSVLDPAYPPTYLNGLLSDLDARWLVADPAHVALAREVAPETCQLVRSDILGVGDGEANLDLRVASDAPAVIIYTSGSTGRPKGVARSHRLLLYRAHLDHDELSLGPADRAASLTLPAFGGPVTDLMSNLLNGTTLLPLDARHQDIGALAEWMAQARLTFLRPPLGLLRQLLAGLDPDAVFPSLRIVELGGDVLYRQDVLRLLPRVRPDCRFIHRYATSETGVVARLILDPERDLSDDIIPLGYPTPGRQVLILDEQGQPVTLGETGQIVVRSRVLATGYWRRPDLTDRRFVPDASDPTASLYYTGDLGRLLPDGRLVFVGRRDSQVKIRGFQVGLGTVESALRDLPVVREAAVVAQPGPGDERRIIAYVVLQDKAYPLDHLRRQLADVLPPYMMPAAFVTLDALPLAANGKVDRHALPQPDRRRPALATPWVAPRTPTETQVASIWRDVLGLEEIGVHDGFLDLGGDSLLAAQVSSRVNRRFQARLPVRMLLQAATIADMAALLDTVDGDPLSQRLPGLVAEVEQLSEAEAERLLQGETAHAG